MQGSSAHAQAYALPIKMKYDCPPANRFGEDAPLWRTGMEAFVPVLRGITSGLNRLGERRSTCRGLLVSFLLRRLWIGWTPLTAIVQS